MVSVVFGLFGLLLIMPLLEVLLHFIVLIEGTNQEPCWPTPLSQNFMGHKVSEAWRGREVQQDKKKMT